MEINYDVILGYWELYLLVLTRITGFVFLAPFFSAGNVPQKVKIAFSVFLSFLVFSVMPEQNYAYETTFQYAFLVIKESLIGMIFGFSANICMQALHFAGFIIDINVGMSMSTMYNPATQTQVNVSGNFYFYCTYLLMLITGLYQFLIQSIVETFDIIPIGQGTINPFMYESIIGFVTDYFIVGFRIALPVFISIMLLNCILGILAKIAPQMNMFAVGIQLKLIAGLFVMFVTIGLLPSISSFLMQNIKDVVIKVASGMQ